MSLRECHVNSKTSASHGPVSQCPEKTICRVHLDVLTLLKGYGQRITSNSPKSGLHPFKLTLILKQKEWPGNHSEALGDGHGSQ